VAIAGRRDQIPAVGQAYIREAGLDTNHFIVAPRSANTSAMSVTGTFVLSSNENYEAWLQAAGEIPQGFPLILMLKLS
jgi:hypothetical protein